MSYCSVFQPLIEERRLFQLALQWYSIQGERERGWGGRERERGRGVRGKAKEGERTSFFLVSRTAREEGGRVGCGGDSLIHL